MKYVIDVWCDDVSLTPEQAMSFSGQYLKTLEKKPIHFDLAEPDQLDQLPQPLQSVLKGKRKSKGNGAAHPE